MLRIAVCDDMPDFLDQIQQCILRWPDGPDRVSVDTFTDADTLITSHSHTPFDIILLDVVMPLLSGIDAAKEIRQQDKSVKIVFLTSSPEFAVDSYRVKASNYLLKPLESGNLYACLDELAEELRASARKICIRGIHAMYQIPVADIEYIESQNKRILFVLSGGETIISGEPLYAYEEKLTLEEGFFKCSRSFIVNIHLIETFMARELRTRSGARIPISRSCHQEFEKAYFSVLFGTAEEEL